jgi:hypothetical protein
MEDGEPALVGSALHVPRQRRRPLQASINSHASPLHRMYGMASGFPPGGGAARSLDPTIVQVAS